MATADSGKGLFNEFGIRLPYEGLEHKVDEPNWDFHYSAPQFFGQARFAQALAQFTKHLPADSKLPDLADFYGRFMAIIETVSARKEVSGILNGPCLPLVFAAGAIRIDFGKYLEKTVLTSVKSAYEERFSKRLFNNYRQRELARQVKHVPESNFKLLLEGMAAGPVVAAYFPDALRAWSVFAAREQMKTLPRDLRFVLPDATVHGHAHIGYPDAMARDCRVPGQDCAANVWESANAWESARFSLYFKATDDVLEFRTFLGNVAHFDGLVYASGSSSSGLLLIG